VKCEQWITVGCNVIFWTLAYYAWKDCFEDLSVIIVTIVLCTSWTKTYLSRQQIIFYNAIKRPLSLSLLIRTCKMNYSLAASVHIIFLRHTFPITKYTKYRNMNKTCPKTTGFYKKNVIAVASITVLGTSFREIYFWDHSKLLPFII